MAIETTCTRLRDNLATVLDQVANDQEVVIVRRRGAPDVALIPSEELTSLMETAHLLRSPRMPSACFARFGELNAGRARHRLWTSCGGR